MFFTVIDGRPPQRARVQAFLVNDNWDDWFKFATLYSLIYVDNTGEHHAIGGIKIGQFGMSRNERRARLPREFDALDERYFSLGQDDTQTRPLPNGGHEYVDVRLDDGYWGFPATARHKNVSGALLLPRPHLWDLRNDRWQPLLLRNPWADHPLPDGFMRLPGYSLNAEGELSPAPGTSFADILALPAVWPPEN